MVLDDALDADPTAAVDDGLGALQQLHPTLCTALVPVLTILWNIGGDISKLSSISFKGDLMVFGHIAIGLVAKKAAPRVSVGVLLATAEALDIL